MLERFQDEDGFVGYRSPLLTDQGIPHLFTTRIGGFGRHELDLGRLVEHQKERVTHAAGVTGARIVSVKQVHGARVLVVLPDALPETMAEADGLVSERDDVLVCIHVADCVSVLLARSDGRRVAAVHAGWRGLVAGVIPRALELLGPGHISAAIGPCLSLAHFEVGPEVVAAFTHAGLGASVHERAGQRAHIDLRAAAAHQLAAGGVRLVEGSDRCTYAHDQEFYSYRRDVTHGGRGHTGRLAALIAAAPERSARARRT
ncbi:MAG: peptidoglycan editing factor PgeF [Planctomycetes bacterium]|nr:peptidoglycan editing factor PgeF [Planctomycetota bacterium]